jgi:NAD(P)H-dependent flavin oxidoreductase YrpB (nitropropane dioxygenase family)
MRTRICTLLGISHPVVLGGMGVGTGPELVAAVSNAGGLGIQGGCAGLQPEAIAEMAAAIRRATDRPFGLNLLLFHTGAAEIDAVLTARPAVLSSSWARADQDLTTLFTRSHEAGVPVMHMVATTREAYRAAEAGADIIVAQGTDGGGHVGLTGTMALVPMVVRAVAPTPVVAAGGLADGAGLAAALMLGADGALYGTRFLATREARIPASYKRVIVDSDGHDTLVTDIPDLAYGAVWPGAYARVVRNRFIETWIGREEELRYGQIDAAATVARAFAAEDADRGVVYAGQSSGSIDAVEPAGTVVEKIVAQAVELLRHRAADLVEDEVRRLRGPGGRSC